MANHIRLPAFQDVVLGVQLGMLVQSAPLAAYGVHTSHAAKYATGGAPFRPLAVTLGRAVYAQLEASATGVPGMEVRL